MVVETAIRPHEPRNVVVVVRARRAIFLYFTLDYSPPAGIQKHIVVAVDVAINVHAVRIVVVACVRRAKVYLYLE